MELQSVKETASRFKISERRVQKLCEEGRIEGAVRISNVWLIPDDAKKPIDERIVPKRNGLMSLKEVCNELSMSLATGRNWIKLGKLKPTIENFNTPFFSHEYISEVKNTIKDINNATLKTRRNKKYITGNYIYSSYISSDSGNISVVKALFQKLEEKNVDVTDEVMGTLILECAIQLILNRQDGKKRAQCLKRYLNSDLRCEKEAFLIDDLLALFPNAQEVNALYEELFTFKYTFEANEDVLGLLYISLKNIGNRKAAGAYYTPTSIVKKMCSRLFSMDDSIGKDVLDPCCGTGNFILQLPSYISHENVYGFDIDPMSVKIARINYALKYDVFDQMIINEHIMEKNYILGEKGEKKDYDYIIGNPPWGYEFSPKEKKELRMQFKSARGSSIESYDLFVERALFNLNRGGSLAFVLPEAILNVRLHRPIREIMLDCSSFKFLEFLGNAFENVQCPSIILEIIYTGEKFDSSLMRVKSSDREFLIKTKRKVDPEVFSFLMDDQEYAILEKIEGVSNKTTLENQSRFALGIVTGDNDAFICKNKRPDNELVLRGSDLRKYRIKPSGNYLSFLPDKFQQVAPVDIYHAPEKLLYRFICGELVFAYDNKQTLSLNSCNILIPEIDGLSIKYVLAILNSRVAQFYFKNRFNSLKVLKSHIESIPIVVADKDVQNDIAILVDRIIEAKDEEVTTLYEDLDKRIVNLYGLDLDEYRIVKSSVDCKNKFLV